MFDWLTKGGGSKPAESAALNLETIQQQDRAILFKHSRTCPVSWAAQSEVKRFSSLHPEIPVYTVVVQEDREFSRQVAEWTGIRHESPQVFVLRKGKVISSDSHEGVTVEFLTGAVAE